MKDLHARIDEFTALMNATTRESPQQMAVIGRSALKLFPDLIKELGPLPEKNLGE